MWCRPVAYMEFRPIVGHMTLGAYRHLNLPCFGFTTTFPCMVFVIIKLRIDVFLLAFSMEVLSNGSNYGGMYSLLNKLPLPACTWI